MSQHIVAPGVMDEQPNLKFVFGWDQPLQSFYLQVHDMSIEEEDDQIIERYGASPDTTMYEVKDLVKVAKKHGLKIDSEMETMLYGEKDDGV